jgi:DNA replication protein DnaC
MASKDASNYLKHLKKLSKTNLLLIDDFGISALFDYDRKYFLEIISNRYMAGSTIITIQFPIKEWNKFMGKPTIADAVMDRLLHISYKFELRGGSMRKPQKTLNKALDCGIF